MNVRDNTVFRPFVANSQPDIALFAISIPANGRKTRSHLMDANTTYSIIEEVESNRSR
jgi:surfactin synthase thioesterase subunit